MDDSSIASPPLRSVGSPPPVKMSTQDLTHMRDPSMRSIGSPLSVGRATVVGPDATITERKNASLRSSTLTGVSVTQSAAGGQPPPQRQRAPSELGRLLDFKQLSRSRLKQVRSISALMAGFALEGLVQINIVSDMSSSILTAYGVVTALLIAVNLFALMIATCLLPTLESTPLLDSVEEEASSFESRFRKHIYVAWICSTGLGILLFVVDMALIGWIQFYKFHPAAIGVTVVAIPTLLIVFVFGFRFYNMLVALQLEAHKRALDRYSEPSVLHV